MSYRELIERLRSDELMYSPRMTVHDVEQDKRLNEYLVKVQKALIKAADELERYESVGADEVASVLNWLSESVPIYAEDLHEDILTMLKESEKAIRRLLSERDGLRRAQKANEETIETLKSAGLVATELAGKLEERVTGLEGQIKEWEKFAPFLYAHGQLKEAKP